MKKDNLSKLIPTVVALAMGIASIVLLILGESVDTVIVLLAIGLVCLAYIGMGNLDKKE